jgi:hypothetical protein
MNFIQNMKLLQQWKESIIVPIYKLTVVITILTNIL